VPTSPLGMMGSTCIRMLGFYSGVAVPNIINIGWRLAKLL